jgi:formylglycine-generating enzyme required for sulfatase activity
MAAGEDERGMLNRFRNAVLGESKAASRKNAKTVARAKSMNPTAAQRPTPLMAPAVLRLPTFETGDHPLMYGHPPDWASGWGDDPYGVWIELTVGEATQRMRWIGPARFRMGSPMDEPGRFGEDELGGGYNEGPCHEVRISRGFWLFDTPVTQELWQAVMGENPSRFVDPKRPVEGVSWNDAMTFIELINARVPNLDLVLPTEAQWEYACRAGTDTATYVGAMEILGENNAPILDAIAWYSGNSGVDFDLPYGVDSSSWAEKQHEHGRAGTRPVGLKKPNAWGLHDMLGNVVEWCADDLRSFSTDSATDPVGGLDSSARRALRGGSWNDDARRVRAADRYALARDERDDDFGFRCARVRP